MKTKQTVNQPTGLTAKPVTKNAVPATRPNTLQPVLGYTPFTMMRRFTEDMERIFDNFNGFNLMPRFEDFGFPQFEEFNKIEWLPEVEVSEKNGQFLVRADLPGMKKEDIEVEMTDDAIIISGERKLETEEEKEGYFHSERSYGSFYRSIPLPEGFHADKANASFTDGVLEVTVAVPKREPKARKLEIEDKATKTKAKTA